MRRSGSRFGRRSQPTVRSPIAGLLALAPETRWWHAGVGAVAGGAGVESEWTDQVHGDVVLQTSDAAKPVLGASWSGGRAAWTFTKASSQYLSGTLAAAALLHGTAKYTLLLVAQLDPASLQASLTVGSSTTANRASLGAAGGGGRVISWRYAPANANTSGTEPPTGHTVFASEFTGTTLRTLADGALVGTAATATSIASLDTILVGCWTGDTGVPGNFAQAIIRHALVVPGAALYTDQPSLAARLTAYLASA